jgi:hypothetical protein
MKKQLDIKKLLLLNMPYILMGLFATNFGEAWRMAVGADASAKMLSFFSTLPVALKSFWPSLHPLDLLVGLCCGAGLRLAVYLKSKNAKKYRHGMTWIVRGVRETLPSARAVSSARATRTLLSMCTVMSPRGPLTLTCGRRWRTNRSSSARL